MCLVGHFFADLHRIFRLWDILHVEKGMVILATLLAQGRCTMLARRVSRLQTVFTSGIFLVHAPSFLARHPLELTTAGQRMASPTARHAFFINRRRVGPMCGRPRIPLGWH